MNRFDIATSTRWAVNLSCKIPFNYFIFVFYFLDISVSMSQIDFYGTIGHRCTEMFWGFLCIFP